MILKRPTGNSYYHCFLWSGESWWSPASIRCILNSRFWESCSYRTSQCQLLNMLFLPDNLWTCIDKYFHTCINTYKTCAWSMVVVEFNQNLIRKWKSLIVIETSDELVGHGRYASYCTPGKICLYINDCYYVWKCDVSTISATSYAEATLITRFMGPTWGPSGADRPRVGPMLSPWSLLSGTQPALWIRNNSRKHGWRPSCFF